MKSQGRVKIARVAVLLVLCAAAFGWPSSHFLRSLLAKKKTQRTRVLLREVRVALETNFVDDCGNTDPAEDNYLPAKLTTPIAYMSKLPSDPFSRAGETFKYVNQDNAGNATEYLLVSRGPDGDWDVDKIRERHAVQPRAWPDEHKWSSFVYESTGSLRTSDRLLDDPYWRGKLAYIELKTGERFRVHLYDVRSLPKPEPSRWLGAEEMQKFLEASGVHVYDPTNGLMSDGDIISTNADNR